MSSSTAVKPIMQAIVDGVSSASPSPAHPSPAQEDSSIGSAMKRAASVTSPPLGSVSAPSKEAAKKAKNAVQGALQSAKEIVSSKAQEAASNISSNISSAMTSSSSKPGSTSKDAVKDEDDRAAPKGGHRRLLVLLHGEKASEPMVRAAIARLRSEGHEVTVRVTYESGDVDRLVKEALSLHTADTLVAAGGDGTVCEVVAALLEHTGGLQDTRNSPENKSYAEVAATPEGRIPRLSVGLLPMGTSNDFAGTTGLPNDPYECLLLATRDDTAKPLDVGLLNGKVFMNTATIGASAEIGKVTSSRIKKLLGPMAFLFTGFRAAAGWTPIRSVVRFPDLPRRQGSVASSLLSQMSYEEHEAEPVEASPIAHHGPPDSAADLAAQETRSKIGQLVGVPLLHLTAANNRQIASMVSIAPNALLDDGMLDCIYVTGSAADHAKRMLRDLFRKGAHRAKSASSMLRVPWLEISTEQPMEWSTDGDPMDPPSTNFRFSLLHRSVYMHLPDDRMLVAGQEAADGVKEKHKKGSRNPFKIAAGKMKAPSLADMFGRVVRFQKQKDWRAFGKKVLNATIRTLVVASLGGLAVHYVENREGSAEESRHRVVARSRSEKTRSARTGVAKGFRALAAAAIRPAQMVGKLVPKFGQGEKDSSKLHVVQPASAVALRK